MEALLRLRKAKQGSSRWSSPLAIHQRERDRQHSLVSRCVYRLRYTSPAEIESHLLSPFLASQCRRRKIKCNRAFPCEPCIERGDAATCEEFQRGALLRHFLLTSRRSMSCTCCTPYRESRCHSRLFAHRRFHDTPQTNGGFGEISLGTDYVQWIGCSAKPAGRITAEHGYRLDTFSADHAPWRLVLDDIFGFSTACLADANNDSYEQPSFKQSFPVQQRTSYSDPVRQPGHV